MFVVSLIPNGQQKASEMVSEPDNVIGRFKTSQYGSLQNRPLVRITYGSSKTSLWLKYNLRSV
jgi:hypothetical protein